MIEQALYEHLTSQTVLTELLTTYDDEPAIFNQEAPSDMDDQWMKGSQYGRIIFAEDIQGDPERTMGGLLMVDIQCNEAMQAPEDIEPLIRQLVHGYFFSNGTFTVSAQWKNTSYFTEQTDHVIGCTVTFDLLAFPVLTTTAPDVIDRFNEWSSKIPGLHVINHDELPSTAWKPEGDESAVYWRVLSDNPAQWIPDTFQTIWRTATVKGHIFSQDVATAATVARDLVTRMYTDKRLLRAGEAPIMVNRRNTIDNGADPLRTGQVTCEATFGIIVYKVPDTTIDHINYE